MVIVKYKMSHFYRRLYRSFLHPFCFTKLKIKRLYSPLTLLLRQMCMIRARETAKTTSNPPSLAMEDLIQCSLAPGVFTPNRTSICVVAFAGHGRITDRLIDIYTTTQKHPSQILISNDIMHSMWPKC